MRKLDGTMCNSTFYAKLKGTCKATVFQQISRGKLEVTEVLGGTSLIKLNATDLEEIKSKTVEKINAIKLTAKPRVKKTAEI